MIYHNEKLQEYLSQSEVKWIILEESAAQEIEARWRNIYGSAFVGRPRLRHGAKAEYEYQQEPCSHYLIVPFSARLAGTAVQANRHYLSPYECHGPLVPLGDFCGAEFLVCPVDCAWTMIHTHEDHSYGGPYFIRAEWLPETVQ